MRVLPLVDYFTARAGAIVNTGEDAMSTQSLEVPTVGLGSGDPTIFNEPCELLIILPLVDYFTTRAGRAIGKAILGRCNNVSTKYVSISSLVKITM